MLIPCGTHYTIATHETLPSNLLLTIIQQEQLDTMQDIKTMNMQQLDAATTEFLVQFGLGLSSVKNVSGEFDHSNKSLKARGGYSAVYVTHWAPQGARSTQVSPPRSALIVC